MNEEDANIVSSRLKYVTLWSFLCYRILFSSVVCYYRERNGFHYAFHIARLGVKSADII